MFMAPYSKEYLRVLYFCTNRSAWGEKPSTLADPVKDTRVSSVGILTRWMRVGTWSIGL